MTKRRWTLWAAIILLAAGLALLDAYVHRHDAGTSAREALLSLCPQRPAQWCSLIWRVKTRAICH